jgi:DNA-binding SARP family transcriptional activator
MTKLSLTLLGGFQARVDCGPALSLPMRKAQALLAYLALPVGRAHPRDKLAALLWGGIRDESARASLRQALFWIRKALGEAEGAVRHDGDTLALDSTLVQVDATQFERAVNEGAPESLAHAAELYHGDLLAGFVVDEAAFEEWLLGERERLHELALEALARLLTYQRKSGSTETAIQTALRLLALDPLQEPVHRALMRLYAEAGRRGTALRQYQQCVSVLARELGIEPEPETKALYQEILQARPSRRMASDPAEGIAPAAARAPATEIPLVGREAELHGLLEAFEQARAGHGSVTVVIGEAGIGKTRLVGEVIGLAEARGARVMLGRSYESEQVLPFGPWVDAFRAAPTVVEALKSSSDVFEVFQRVTGALRTLAGERVLVVVLEDVQWADEMTARLMAYVGRRLADAAALVVATVRREELSETALLHRALDELQRDGQLRRVAVDALSRESTFALVRALARGGTDAPTLARLGEVAWRVSAGNPFVVVETVRSPDPGAGLTEPVRQLVSRRLERLSERARLLTTVAAVIGREFEFALLRHASELPDAQVAEGVEELVRAGVLHGVGERFDFTHDRIRDVVLGALVAPRRRVLHRAAAEAIETTYGDDVALHVLALGLHCVAAEMWPEAVRHLGRAADHAFSRSAYREAATCLEHALAAVSHLPRTREILDETLDLHLQLRTALWPLAEFDRIARALEDAEPLAMALGDRPRLGRIAAFMSVLRWITGDFRAARAFGQRARNVATALGDEALGTMSAFYVGLAHHLLGEYDDAEAAYAACAQALECVDGAHVLGAARWNVAVLSRAWRVLPLAERGAFPAAFEHGMTALRLAEKADDLYGIVSVGYCLAYLHCQLGEFDRAIPLLERAAALVRDREITNWLPQVTGYLGHAYAQSGRVQEGLELLGRAMDVYAATRARPFRTLLTVHRGSAHLLVGRVDVATTIANQALTLAREHHERGHEAWALRLLGEVSASAGSSTATDVERYYGEAMKLASALGMRPLLARCHLELGTFLVRAGDATRAREHLTTAAASYGDLDMDASRARAEAALT